MYLNTLLAVASCGVSAYLTFQFMSDLGDPMGMALAMGIVGLCLEAGKAAFSAEMASAHRLGLHIKSIGLSVVVAGLMSLSVLASVSALETGVNTAKTQSVESQSILSQISRLESSAAADIENGYRQRALETEGKIAELRGQLTNQGDTVIAEYGRQVSIVIAVALELVSVIAVAITTCGNALSRKDNGPSPRTQSTQSHTVELDPVVPRVSTVTRSDEVTVAFRDTVKEIKSAIVAGMITPSHRGVTKKFPGVSRDSIRAALEELFTAGVLVEYRNGYKLA